MSADAGTRTQPAVAGPTFVSALRRSVDAAMPHIKQGEIDATQALAWLESKANEGKLFKRA